MFRQQLAKTTPDALHAVLVSTERLWHGGEGQLRLLAIGLRDRGNRVSILARRGGRFAERMAAERFDVCTFAGNPRSPLAIWRMRRMLLAARPDLLYFNDAHAVTAGGLASWALPAMRIAARRVDFPLRSAIKYRRACDQLICVSQAVARVCVEGGIPPHQVRIVHEGVDPARVLAGDRERGRRSLELESDQPLILCVATLTDHKGHRYLLEAFSAVLARHPRACLALAGDGELTESLRAQARKLGVASQVRFLGFRQDVPDLMMACDVFVIPSHMEGLCTSIIDAMFAARPIVTTTAGGIPDLVGSRSGEDDSVAWLVPPRDASALANALVAAIDATPGERHALGNRAAERAQRDFTADRMVDETLAVYQEVIAARRRAA